MNSATLQKWYTRIIGVFFILVSLTLIKEFVTLGITPEFMHRLFHVILGSLVVYFGWNNKKFWKPFCIVNGAFFTYVAVFGWLFPDFAGLAAFNFADTILHSVVGLSGLIIGGLKK